MSVDGDTQRIPLAEPRWRTLLGNIRALRMEVKRLAPERSVGLSGNPAAPECAIRVAELRLGHKLPPSYREFLSFSDGWPAFFENADLFGTCDIGRQLRVPSDARPLPETLLPFGSDKNGTSLFAFDTSVRAVDGELPVIAWIGGLGLDCRCFTGFLAMALQLCRAELVSLKAVTPALAAARRRSDLAVHAAEKLSSFTTAAPALRALASACDAPEAVPERSLAGVTKLG